MQGESGLRSEAASDTGNKYQGPEFRQRNRGCDEVIALSARLWYRKLEREKRKTLRVTMRVMWLLLCSIFGKEVSDAMKF